MHCQWGAGSTCLHKCMSGQYTHAHMRAHTHTPKHTPSTHPRHTHQAYVPYVPHSPPPSHIVRGGLQSPIGLPEPPSLIFILRLHLEYLVRKRLAVPNASARHFPPPLDAAASPRRVEDAPELLCCPVSQSLLLAPVVTPSGSTFEHAHIRRWVGWARAGGGGAPVSLRGRRVYVCVCVGGQGR